jgi:hypothetical protein
LNAARPAPAEGVFGFWLQFEEKQQPKTVDLSGAKKITGVFMSNQIIGSRVSHSIARLFAGYLCLAAAIPFTALNSAAQTPTLWYSAGAYGTYALAGDTVVTAKTAPVGVGPGCGTPQIGASATGTVATVNHAPLVVTGVINTAASTAENTATGSSEIHGIALLGGVITADEVKAVSTTANHNGTLQLSAAGSNLVNLVVAGTVINSMPAPNTTIALPGLGDVVLNEQIASSQDSKASLTVNMIHVRITVANDLNLKVGTQIILADAHSGLARVSGPGVLDGTAFGTSVSSKLLRSTPTAEVSVGCEGNALRTNTQAGINVPGVLSSGTITNTAQGTVDQSVASSQTSSTAHAVNLLGGLVTADTVEGRASASTSDGKTFNFNATGSFVNLAVSGHPEITDSVAQDTEVTLTGIGTLYLYRVRTSANNTEVRMIEIVLAPDNVLGLPTGLDARVSDAEASLHSLDHP